jgi:predicted Fe-Mo cluster-binding NifX family protein
MVLLSQVEQGLEVSRRLLDLEDLYPEEIPARLAAEGVRVLFCGGIHPRFRAMLESEGIELYSGLIGPADTALQLYRQGRLESGQILCAGESSQAGASGGGRS